MPVISSGYAPDGAPFQQHTLRNSSGMEVSVMDWGATLLSIKVPLTDGSVREVILGCQTPEDYLRQNACLGATIGRYANRIAQAYLQRTGTRLVANQPPHQLHGGPEGFHCRRWETVAAGTDMLHYRLHSPDGDQGFPGHLTVNLRYQLKECSSLQILFEAVCDAATPLALTNHAYFNLDAQHGEIFDHRLKIAADYFQPVSEQGIPDAPLSLITGTGFDFSQPKTLAADFLKDQQQKNVAGYDHAFLLHPRQVYEQPAAQLWSSDQILQLQIFTDSPALQVYTGNFLNGTPARSGEYKNHQGIALEPGYLPDSANHPEWSQPDCWLSPDQPQQTMIRYQFISV